MKASIVFALFAVCVLQLAARALPQQTQKARVEGIILRAGNGDAVPRARVTLNRQGGRGAAPAVQAGQPAAARGANPQLPPIQPVMTDDQGKFAFPEVDEGSYTLQVQANGYVSTNYGQRYANGPGIPLALKAGQALRDLSIKLIPASNISGRIRDTADQPLMNVPVQLLRYSYDNQGQRSYQPAGSARTDDHGDYRIFWMTPGRYFLMAGDPSGANSLIAMIIGIEGGNSNPNNVPQSLSYAFYPGVTDIRTAQPIELQPGADLEGANLILTPKPPSFRVRGKLTDARTGMPPAQARVAASSQAIGPRSNGELDQIALELPINSYNSTTGAFEIRDLLTGNYVVSAISEAVRQGVRGTPGAPQQGPSMGTAAVAVGKADVEDVNITVNPPTALSGRLRVDSTAAVAMDRIRVQLSPRSTSSVPPSLLYRNNSNTTAAADGSFNFASVSPGEYRLVLQSQGALPTAAGAGQAPGPIYIKEARFDGSDVLNGPLKISGSASSQIEIVIGVGGGRISGVVNDRRSQPVAVAQVVLVPERVRDRTDLYRTATSDENGKFLFNAVIPGDYRVFSWEGQEQYSWFDPDLLAQSEGNSKVVHVTEQSADMIDVKFIPKEGAQ